MNSFIIQTIRSRKTLTVASQTEQRTKSSDTQIFIILLLVTFSFLLLTIPAYMLFLFNMISISLPDIKQDLNYFTVWPKKTGTQIMESISFCIFCLVRNSATTSDVCSAVIMKMILLIFKEWRHQTQCQHPSALQILIEYRIVVSFICDPFDKVRLCGLQLDLSIVPPSQTGMDGEIIYRPTNVFFAFN